MTNHYELWRRFWYRFKEKKNIWEMKKSVMTSIFTLLSHFWNKNFYVIWQLIHFLLFIDYKSLLEMQYRDLVISNRENSRITLMQNPGIFRIDKLSTLRENLPITFRKWRAQNSWKGIILYKSVCFKCLIRELVIDFYKIKSSFQMLRFYSNGIIMKNFGNVSSFTV